MTAISRNKVKLWVVPSGTAASALVSTAVYDETTKPTGYISGEIKSYSKTGGETDVESDPVFGGYVDKEKPQSQFELEFEIVPSLEKADIWEAMVYGYDTTNKAYTTAKAAPSDRAVFIEAVDGTSNPAAWGFNNCNVTVLDQEHNADDNMSKTMTLKFGPTDSDGNPNFLMNAYSKDNTFAEVQDLPNWDAAWE